MSENKVMRFEKYFKEYLSRGIVGGAFHKGWNYKDDITILGAYDLFCASGDFSYRDEIIRLTEGVLVPDGKLKEHNLDFVSAAKTDIILGKLTGEARYQKRLLDKQESLKTHPRTKTGNFWHKQIYPYQVWLDGLYMAMPIYLQDPSNEEDTIRQFENVRKYLFDEKLQLYYHAWDESRAEEWADPETGKSPCVWLRAEGWYLMALCDCYELVQKQKNRDYLVQLLQEAVEGILPYQDEKTKMFYQLVDLAAMPGNYPEVSGSAMVAYALMKGKRLGMLPDWAYAKGVEILEGIADTYLKEKDGRLTLEGICASAGLGAGPDHRTDRDGSPEYYLSEKQIPDNQHGTAACMMAYSEYLLNK